MKITFSKKTSLSRKSLLWIYFLIILILAAALSAIGYFLLTEETHQEVKAEVESIKINESKLNELKDFTYIGTPIDLSYGLGKKEPFR